MKVKNFLKALFEEELDERMLATFRSYLEVEVHYHELKTRNCITESDKDMIIEAREFFHETLTQHVEYLCDKRWSDAR